MDTTVICVRNAVGAKTRLQWVHSGCSWQNQLTVAFYRIISNVFWLSYRQKCKKNGDATDVFIGGSTFIVEFIVYHAHVWSNAKSNF